MATRREFLAGVGSHGPDRGRESGPSVSRRGARLPEPSASGLDHFVEICMENRSYDHWLGARKLLGQAGRGRRLKVAGMSNPRLDGSLVGFMDLPADVHVLRRRSRRGTAGRSAHPHSSTAAT